VTGAAAATPSPGSEAVHATHLRRALSLPLVTLYGLGTTIGAGIYVLVGKVAGVAGLLAPASFLLAMVVTAFSALCFAELGSRYPRSAGEALYVAEGLRSPFLSLFVGLLVVVAGVVTSATVTHGFIGYLGELIDVPKIPAIVVTVAALTLLAIWGIKQAVMVAATITLLEIAGLLLALWVGREAFAALPAALPDMVPTPDRTALLGLLMGGVLAFFAFIGFEDLANVAEEVKHPRRTLPLAIGLTLLVTTLLYVAVAVVMVLAIPLPELGASDAPLALLFTRYGGLPPEAITLISLLSIINGALIQIIMASRMLYGLAVMKRLPAVFAYVHPRTHTPAMATLAVGLLIVGFALAAPLLTLAQMTSFIVLLIFFLVDLALAQIKLRRQHAPPDAFVVARWVPMVGAGGCFAMMVFQAVELLFVR
jgi:amino acid transporter